jgi:hypothetical protein
MLQVEPKDNEVTPPNRERYTLDGDAAVEARIADDQSRIAEAVTRLVPSSVFRGLVLMGGYGRGEGGYVRRDGRPEPYNDYDYFVVVRGLGRKGRKALEHALADRAKTLENEVGVEVDFALLREERLRKAEYSLMNAEMLWGHRVVAGDSAVLGSMPSMPFSGLPLGEFTRLMLNRGALLLMNRQRLGVGASLEAAAREVFFKYLFKAILACGDARLAGLGRYHPSYVVKLERLRRSDWPGKDAFMEVYSRALDNKFHPAYGRYAAENAEAEQDRVVTIWLETLAWLEGIRVGRAIGDWEAYASPAVPKGQHQASWGVLRHLATTARDFGLVELLREPRWSQRYPRERLISVLPLLLGQPRDRLQPMVGRALALPRTASPEEAFATFLGLWRRYA